MTLDEVLENKNVNGEVYTSDVVRWLEWKINVHDCARIAKKLSEMREPNGEN